jgi:hypothetical protein
LSDKSDDSALRGLIFGNAEAFRDAVDGGETARGGADLDQDAQRKVGVKRQTHYRSQSVSPRTARLRHFDGCPA